MEAESRRYLWDFCTNDFGTSTYNLHQGERALSDDEYDSVVSALAEVHSTSALQCAVDAGYVTLDVVTSTTTELLVEGNACGAHPDRTPAKGVIDLEKVLLALPVE